LDEAKKHCRIYHSEDDAYVQGVIAAAVEKAESYLRRKLITQTWKVYLDDWPGSGFISLPFGQLQSVTHVKYTDSDGDQSTFSSDYYGTDTDSEPGRVVLNYGESWPTAVLATKNPIEIQFVCGYGDHTLQTITGATNASPIVLSVATHGRTANDTVLVENVEGNTNANGVWKITVPTTSTIGLIGSSGNADYTSGGTLTCLEVPEQIRHAIKIIISDMYEQREGHIAGVSFQMLDTVKALLFSKILWGTVHA
jgi:uncharacterized phiE125 gp8 family phage protein